MNMGSIARAWQVSGDKNYFKIAYEVVETADILKDYHKEWNKWDGNIVGNQDKHKPQGVDDNLIILIKLATKVI